MNWLTLVAALVGATCSLVVVYKQVVFPWFVHDMALDWLATAKTTGVFRVVIEDRWERAARLELVLKQEEYSGEASSGYTPSTEVVNGVTRFEILIGIGPETADARLPWSSV